MSSAVITELGEINALSSQKQCKKSQVNHSHVRMLICTFTHVVAGGMHASTDIRYACASMDYIIHTHENINHQDYNTKK